MSQPWTPDRERLDRELLDLHTALIGVVRLLASSPEQVEEAKAQVRRALERVRSAADIPWRT